MKMLNSFSPSQPGLLSDGHSAIEACTHRQLAFQLRPTLLSPQCSATSLCPSSTAGLWIHVTHLLHRIPNCWLLLVLLCPPSLICSRSFQQMISPTAILIIATGPKKPMCTVPSLAFDWEPNSSWPYSLEFLCPSPHHQHIFVLILLPPLPPPPECSSLEPPVSYTTVILESNVIF